MNSQLPKKFHLYQLSVVFSVLFALAGFSYNIWRMEITEENDTTRTASFEILINLSSLEHLIYTAYYDGDLKEGNPRKGWIQVGLINDLSTLTDESVSSKSAALKEVWATHWEAMATNEESVKKIVSAIDSVRDEIKLLLSSLE